MLALAIAGSLYALLAAAVLPRLTNEPAPALPNAPGVTVLKPLRGAEPSLYESLASFCDQDFAGPVQIVFGVEDRGDPAVAVVERLVHDHPGADLDLVVTEKRGANPKVANLCGMQRHIRQPLVIIADSDVTVDRNYLTRIARELEHPAVGLVTCLYRGAARAGFWSRLASMTIDYHFLPGVVLGMRLKLARPCFGSTIALRLATLRAIGGFERFLDHLADDHAIGEAVRAMGLDVVVPRWMVLHCCNETGPAEVAGHELRWARTIRAIDPLGYAGSMLTHAFPLAAVGAALTRDIAAGGIVVVVALTCRLVLALRVDHTLGVPPGRWWLVPLRDLMSFGIFITSFFVDVVSWRGRRYRVRADGTLAPIGEPGA